MSDILKNHYNIEFNRLAEPNIEKCKNFIISEFMKIISNDIINPKWKITLYIGNVSCRDSYYNIDIRPNLNDEINIDNKNDEYIKNCNMLALYKKFMLEWYECNNISIEYVSTKNNNPVFMKYYMVLEYNMTNINIPNEYSRLNKKFNDELKQKNEEINNLKMELLSLKMAPPPEGGELYLQTKQHYETIEQSQISDSESIDSETTNKPNKISKK